MKTKKIFWIGVPLIVGLLTLVIFCWPQPVKVAYVDTAYIYENFTMKKELSKKLEAVRAKRKEVLDSLLTELKTINRQLQVKPQDKIRQNNFESLKREYLAKEEQFSQDNENMDVQYYNEVWKQANEYIAEYGKIHNYQYILGANGQGNLMFADEAGNISKEITAYINEKYNGKK